MSNKKKAIVNGLSSKAKQAIKQDQYNSFKKTPVFALLSAIDSDLKENRKLKSAANSGRFKAGPNAIQYILSHKAKDIFNGLRHDLNIKTFAWCLAHSNNRTIKQFRNYHKAFAKNTHPFILLYTIKHENVDLFIKASRKEPSTIRAQINAGALLSFITNSPPLIDNLERVQSTIRSLPLKGDYGNFARLPKQWLQSHDGCTYLKDAFTIEATTQKARRTLLKRIYNANRPTRKLLKYYLNRQFYKEAGQPIDDLITIALTFVKYYQNDQQIWSIIREHLQQSGYSPAKFLSYLFEKTGLINKSQAIFRFVSDTDIDASNLNPSVVYNNIVTVPGQYDNNTIVGLLNMVNKKFDLDPTSAKKAAKYAYESKKKPVIDWFKKNGLSNFITTLSM